MIILYQSESNVNLSKRNYRRWLEYLFYTTDPEKNNEKEDILRIVEEGFKAAEQYKVCVLPQLFVL